MARPTWATNVEKRLEIIFDCRDTEGLLEARREALDTYIHQCEEDCYGEDAFTLELLRRAS